MVAIVLLPGMDGTGLLFAEFSSALGDQLRPMIVPYPDDHPLDYAALSDHVRTFLPANEPFILLGESFSGPVAIALAAEKPPGLVGLVLCCSFAKNPHPLFGGFKNLARFLPIMKELTGVMAPLLFGRFNSPDLRSAVRHALECVSRDTLRERLKAVLGVDYSAKLKHVAAPILYLQASEDRIVPASAGKFIMKAAPSVQIVKMRGPHLLLQTLPREAATIVLSFAQSSLAASGPDFARHI
jgi:pimeloyl-ACP methyl ester carboxylesterase